MHILLLHSFYELSIHIELCEVLITVESISPHLQNEEECDADSTCIYILISKCVSKVEVSKPPGFLVFMWLQSDALTISLLTVCPLYMHLFMDSK